MNVIWIVSDTLRRDHVGAYGNKWIRTPSLDALAAKSVRFDRYYTASFPTMPNRVDHFTGRFTSSFMHWGPLPEGEVTLAQILSDSRFATAAVVDTPYYLRNDMNYDRGFQYFFAFEGQERRRGEARDARAEWRVEADWNAPHTFIKAGQWLERHYKEDFFLYVDAWDPHEPWDAPKYYTELYLPDYDGEVIYPPYNFWQDIPSLNEEKVKKAHACYCGEVTMVDTWVGYLLRHIENANLMKNTAIIFSTDHGFYFGEHGGRFGKKTLANGPDGKPYARPPVAEAKWARSPLYEEAIAIPLFIYVPGIAPGVYSGLTSAIDLMPTVLDLMGQEVPAHVNGHSLLPTLKDPTKKGREFVISSEPFANPGDIVQVVDNLSRETETGSDTTVTTDEWSLVYDVNPGLSELYHLPSDPKQEKNVINEHVDVARELHQILVKFMHETNVSSRLIEPRKELQL